jgi:raffinose/stachyose/melibiose transport system permease protein
VGLDRYTRRTLLREMAFILVAAVYCIPFYLVITLALETTEQTYKAPLSLPWPPHVGNFAEAWRTGGQGGLPHAFLSSLIITVSSVVGLIVLGSLCAYTIARRPGRLSNVAFVAVVIGIILPSQLALIPLFVAMLHLGLVGNYLGIIVLNIGLLMPLTIFLYTGFIRTLPRDYEESARVDGAGILRIYAKIVFPLLRPVTATVAVLVGVSIWNEFFVAVIFLNGSGHETIPVALYSFAGEGATRANLLFAGIAITIAPILIFYLFAQRHLIRGFTAGVKG